VIFAERKRSVQENPRTATRNKKDVARKKQVPMKKFDSQVTRSPLSVLGHSNSPEPKRMRQNVSNVKFITLLGNVHWKLFYFDVGRVYCCILAFAI